MSKLSRIHEDVLRFATRTDLGIFLKMCVQELRTYQCERASLKMNYKIVTFLTLYIILKLCYS